MEAEGNMFGFQMSGLVGFWLLVELGVPPWGALSLNSFVMDRECLLSTWLLSGAFPLVLSKGSLWPDSFCALGAHRGCFCRESAK